MASPLLGSARKAIRSGVRLSRALRRSGVESSAKRLKREAVARGQQSWSILENEGYLKFNIKSLACAQGTVARIASLCQAWTRNSARTSYDKLFPYNLLNSDDLFEHREFLQLALHDDIIAAISQYFDQVPRLYNLYMWWTPPNQTMERSQLYHYDHRDSRQAKVFINIFDVTPETGPLHFLSVADSLSVDNKVGYSQDRYDDQTVYSACPRSKVQQAVGPAGTAYIVDTARCLHFGSRGNEVQRLILMASFARANSVKPGGGCRVLDPVRERLVRTYYPDDQVRNFILASPK